jgi:hypothetical protein
LHNLPDRMKENGDSLEALLTSINGRLARAMSIPAQFYRRHQLSRVRFFP